MDVSESEIWWYAVRAKRGSFACLAFLAASEAPVEADNPASATRGGGPGRGIGGGGAGCFIIKDTGEEKRTPLPLEGASPSVCWPGADRVNRTIR